MQQVDSKTLNDPRGAGGPQTGLRAVLAALVEGIRCPTMPALVGTLLVFAAEVVLCIWKVTPVMLAGPGGMYILNDPGDDYARLTVESLQLGAETDPTPLIVMTGTSNVREASRTPTEMSQVATAAAGRPVRVGLLAGGGLSIWETMELVEQLGERSGRDSVLVVEISPRRLAKNPDELKGFSSDPRLALDSEWLGEELDRAGLPRPSKSGNYFIDNLRFFVARPGAVANVVRGPVKPVYQYAETWRKLTPAEWDRVRARASEWTTEYEQNKSVNLGALERLIERARGRGFRVLLSESVENPEIEAAVLADEERRRLMSVYRADVQDLVARTGIGYIDATKEIGLTAQDFYDHTHLRNPDARLRFTKAVLAAAAAEFGPRSKETTP